MPSRVFQYEFDASVPMEEVESSLLLSVLGVESMHGETEVHLNAAHSFDLARRTCVVDADSEVGRNLNQIFAGFLRREFGRHQFSVRRIDGPVPFPSDNRHPA